MMRAELPTMANIFAESDYATGHFGKWHLGDSYPHRPQDRGFQETIHHRAWGLTSLADHWENHTHVYYDPILDHNGVDKPFQGYCTDIFFDEAMKWMDEKQSAEQPFFVYLPTNTPHVPDISPDEYSEPYRGNFEGKPIPDQFYGMIANIDANVGRLEAFLEAKGLRENTILIFLADNGTQSKGAQAIFNAGMRERKTSVYEGGHRVPLFVRWPKAELVHGTEIDELTQVQDLFPTLIDLCQLQAKSLPRFDGISLSGLLRGEGSELPDRKLVVQYRSSGEPWNPAVVMWDKWRLLKGKRSQQLELYDVGSDPGQTNNLATAHPDIVKALEEHYESWYAEAKPLFDIPRWITLGSESANPTILYAQDWVGGYCDNPGGLSHATAQGYWNVDVEKEGIYEIGLRRWPRESNKVLTEGWAEGPGGVERSARPIAAANLQISGDNYTLETNPNDTVARFRVSLPAGRTRLETTFMNEKGQALCSAIYTYVNRIENNTASLTPVSDRKPSPAADTRNSGAKPISIARGDILIADFEGEDYGDWTTIGTAFGKGPTETQGRIAGYQGKKVVDTFLISGKSDATKGVLMSPPFTVERRYLNFLVGGGRHSGDTGVALRADGKRVQVVTGNSFKNREGKKVLRWVSWDVAALRGKEVQIEIFDQRKVGWGHIIVDQIFLSRRSASESPGVVGGKPLEKTLIVNDTHLHVPVDNTSDRDARVKLEIHDGETLVQNFDVALPDGKGPDWTATYPLASFDLEGKSITVKLQDPNRNSKGLQEAATTEE